MCHQHIDSILLGFEQDSVFADFQVLRCYYEELSEPIRNKMNKLDSEYNTYKKELEKKTEMARCQFEICYGGAFDDKFDVVKAIEENFHQSMVVLIYSLIEKHMNDICKYIESIKHIPYTCNKRYCGVMDAVNYMMVNVDIEIYEKYIIFLKEICAVRNVIAHEIGKMDHRSDKDIAIIESMVEYGCEIKQIGSCDLETKTVNSEIKIKPEFIVYCFESSAKLFQKIFKAIVEQI